MLVKKVTHQEYHPKQTANNTEAGLSNLSKDKSSKHEKDKSLS